MSQLHERGVDLLLNVQSALEHFDKVKQEEFRALLKETEQVLIKLLENSAYSDSPKG